MGAAYLLMRTERSRLATLLVVLGGTVVLWGFIVTRHVNLDDHIFHSDRTRYWSEFAPVLGVHFWDGWGLGQYKYLMPLLQQPQLIPPEARRELFGNVGDKAGVETALRAVTGGDPAYVDVMRWDEIWLEAHNEYFEAMFSLGIFGLVLLLSVVWFEIRRSGGIARYGLIGSAVSACWFFSWQITPIALVTVLYLATAHGDDGKEEDDNQEEAHDG